MENIISLNHNDIDKAIKAYIADHGVTLDGKTIEIKLNSGRGANAANSASVTVTNKEEAQEEVEQEDAVKSEETASEVTETTEEEDTTEAKEVETDTQAGDPIAETEETAIGTDEVQTDTSEPDDTESLFGG